MTNKSNTPVIRFDGYYGDWKQAKFSDVFDGLQNNTLSRAELNYEKGSVRNVHYGDVLIKYGDYIDVSSADLPFITDESITKKYDNSLLRDGDIVIADTAEDETVGKCCEIVGSDGVRLLSGLHTIACRPKQKHAPKFLGYYINSNSYHRQLIPLMQGIKVTSISKGALQNTDVIAPESFDEQSQIGSFFSNIDDLIALNHHKYDKLVNLKKSMLNKMFPHDGASVPEIRFAGFTDAWEQCKFGEVTILKSASRVHREEWTESGVPFYRSSDVMSAINGTENVKAFISEELYEKLSSVSGKLEEGDVLVTGGGSVGNPYIVPDNKPLYTKDADLLWIKNQGRFDAYFIYEFFFSPTFRNYLGSVSHVGTIAHYTITQLSETPIALPSLEEQKKIGDFFRNLDNLITLHQRKLEKLKNIKKTLSVKMFPN